MSPTEINISPRLAARTLAYSFFIAFCSYQVVVILVEYFQHPFLIGMEEASQPLVTILPGITICNNNRISLWKLASRNPHIKKSIEDTYPNYFSNQEPFIDGSAFVKFRDGISDVYTKHNFSAQNEIDAATLDQLLEMKPEHSKFIEWMGCTRHWDSVVECEGATRIDCLQDRRCVTLLHKGALYYDKFHKPYIFDPVNITNNKGYYDAKEAVRLILNFDPEDYGDLKRQIGARLIFHGSGMVGAATDLDFFVTRGFRYEFVIDRQDVQIGGGCHNYEQINLKRYRDTIDPRVPLSAESCYQNCVIDNIIKISQCYPSNLPYYKNDAFDPHRNLSLCQWFREPQYYAFYRIMQETLERERRQKGRKPERSRPRSKGRSRKTQSYDARKVLSASVNASIKQGFKLFNRVRRYCTMKCPKPCNIIQYKVSMSKTAWPADVVIMLDQTENYKRLRHCCAMISVKFAQYHYNVHELKLKYNWADILNDVGGLLAFWLGISIVSVYRTIQKMAQLITKAKDLIQDEEENTDDEKAEESDSSSLEDDPRIRFSRGRLPNQNWRPNKTRR